MLRALDEYEIEGLKTLIPFHKALLATEQWANAETCRDLVEDKDWLKTLAFEPSRATRRRRRGRAETVEQAYTVEVSGRRFDVKVIGAAARRRRAPPTAPRRAGRARRPSAASARAAAAAAAPTSSSRRCRATSGRCPSSRATRSRRASSSRIIEAMKMENEITAHKAGVDRGAAHQGGRGRSRPARSLAVIKSE